MDTKRYEMVRFMFRFKISMARKVVASNHRWPEYARPPLLADIYTNLTNEWNREQMQPRPNLFDNSKKRCKQVQTTIFGEERNLAAERG
jgi:hypothetical protein